MNLEEITQRSLRAARGEAWAPTPEEWLDIHNELAYGAEAVKASLAPIFERVAELGKILAEAASKPAGEGGAPK